MGRKLALIIGNSDYQDADLARLVTPHEDVNDLADLLRAQDIGEFDEVKPLVNESAAAVRLEIEGFFADKKPDDLLLMYFSGHGVRDDQGQLYLAVKDTRHNRLRATAIPAAFITDGMDHSRSRRQILVLDCCHSGAFAQGAKGVTGESVGIKTAFEGIGYGRVVLTATDATQYAWEGDQVIGEAENSVFTHYLIEGLKTGAADTDSDGRITLDELYDYVYEQVVKATPKQTPGKWSYKQQGELVIAKNPHPTIRPVELPAELRQAIESPFMGVREGAVRELERLLNGSLPGIALAAREVLKRLAEDDSRRVASAAAAVLAAYEAQRSKAADVQAVQPAEAELLALEKAEREWLAREKVEAEQLAAQKAEQERLAKEKAEAERLAVQKAEEERVAREKAEQERLAKEKAEAERLAARRAGEERTALEKAEQGRLAREQVETQRSSMAQTGPPSAAQVIWLPTLLAAIGWGITLAVFLPYGPVAIGAIGGLVTGLTLRWRHPSFRWMQIISISIVWGIGLGIIDLSSSWIGLVGVAISALLSGLVLRWAEPSIGWKPIFTVAVGWGFGWLIGILASSLFGQRVGTAGASGIGGVLVGAVGSGVMHWQLSRARRRKST